MQPHLAERRPRPWGQQGHQTVEIRCDLSMLRNEHSPNPTPYLGNPNPLRCCLPPPSGLINKQQWRTTPRGKKGTSRRTTNGFPLSFFLSYLQEEIIGY